VIHGSQDKQIPSILDKEAVAQLRRLGHRRLSFIEVPDGEHRLSTMQFAPGSAQFDTVVQCCRSSRREPWPPHVLHHAREHATGRAHWVAMDHIAPGRTGRVDARVSGRSRLDIRTTHTSRLRLFLSDRLLDPGRVLMTVNGESQEIDFIPTMVDAVATYAESGADPGLMTQMVVDVEVPEICE
jgi:hypothetical protein